MNRRLLLVVLVVVIILGGIAAVIVLNPDLVGLGGGNNDEPAATQPPRNSPTPEATAIPTATPIQTIDVVWAVQDIPRGVVIQPNMVSIIEFPEEYVPVRAFSTTEEVIGRIARTDIFRENFILANQVVDDLNSLADVGSDVAAVLDPNRVAISLPINRISSVSYALQPGDRVDILVSMLFVDIDIDFQAEEPLSFGLIEANETANSLNITFGGGNTGEADTRQFPIAFYDSDTQSILSRTVTLPIFISPSEDQRPRMVTQRTVQDAQVLWTGEFPKDGVLFRPAATPTPVVTPDPENTATPAPEVQPTPEPPRPDLVTLAVRPQDAVILTYMSEAQLPLTFALRSARSQGLPPTDPVTLDYVLNTFNIIVPDRFNYGLSPAVRSIRTSSLGGTIQADN